MRVQIYVPNSRLRLVNWWKKFCKFRGISFSEEVLNLLEAEKSGNPKMYILPEFVPEFFEFFRAFGAKDFKEREQKDHYSPDFRFMWRDTVIVGLREGETVRFECTNPTLRQEFEQVVSLFYEEVKDKPLTSEGDSE